MEQILLGPEPFLTNHPFAWVLSGQKHVMDVHDYARPKPWQHLQEKISHISANLDDVRGINKQNVPIAELFEKFERDILNRLLHQLQQTGKSTP